MSAYPIPEVPLYFDYFIILNANDPFELLLTHPVIPKCLVRTLELELHKNSGVTGTGDVEAQLRNVSRNYHNRHISVLDLQSEDNSQCTILSKQSQTFVVLRQLVIVKAVSNRYHSLVNGDSCMVGERPGSTNSTIYKVLYDWPIEKVTRYRLRPCATFYSMRH